MRNLLRRSFSGIVYVVLFIFSILFSQESYLIFVSILGVLCIWEFSRIIKFKNPISYFLFLGIIYLIVKRPDNYAVAIILSITVLSSLLLVYQLFAKKDISFHNERSKFGLMMRYMIFSLSFILLLPIFDGDYHKYLMICILILIWVNDSFAFLVGKNFGKRKLFESVSPKKTIEGFVGGLLFAVLASFLISLYNKEFNFFNWAVIAIIISIIGTIGDLIESKFKRFAGVKDSGRIMPGHGGILDRLDSLLFVAPFVYLYIKFIIH
ncbi:phosphatidate cytidylyltransferase [Polaribacter sp.]|nr:phosphatidate cytidylyltransferase [Polaribacter sp.]